MKTQRLLKFFLGCILLSLWMIMPVTSFGQTTHQVSVLNNKFDPATLDINVGDKVVWKNQSGYHNVNGTTTSYPSNPESFGNSEGTNWEYEYVFNTPGTYKYHCNPHVGLGMTGVINVAEVPDITVNFTGMTPHVNQDLWLSVTDPSSGKEFTRVHEVIKESFSTEIYGLEADKSYHIDFYADFNNNGIYDKPGTDHAWRIIIENLTSDTTVNFTHNTNFTDIEWQHRLTVEFTDMTPHVGQFLQFLLFDVTDQQYVDTIELQNIPDAAFEVYSYAIETGKSYNIDFYADFNQNGEYDAPPADHAWRIMLEDVLGDTTVSFAHNTMFTNILEDQATTIRSNNDSGAGINVYPNPAFNNISIDIKGLSGIPSELMIFDVSGKLVLSRDITNNQARVNVDVSLLPKGVYTVRVISESKHTHNKLLIKL